MGGRNSDLAKLSIPDYRTTKRRKNYACKAVGRYEEEMFG